MVLPTRIGSGRNLIGNALNYPPLDQAARIDITAGVVLPLSSHPPTLA